MNKNVRILIFLYIAALILIGVIFVPFTMEIGVDNDIRDIKYSFLWKLTDHATVNGFLLIYRIQFSRLFTELFILTLIAAGILALLWKPSAKESTTALEHK